MPRTMGKQELLQMRIAFETGHGPIDDKHAPSSTPGGINDRYGHGVLQLRCAQILDEEEVVGDEE